MSILGLDISTSCTGWCVLSEDGEILEMNYIDLSRVKDIFEKSLAVESKIKEISKSFQIEKIFVEENLQSFRSGFSSAQTISTLAKFNGIVSFMCFKIFEKKPEFFNVNRARKILGIKIVRKKDGGSPTKDQLFAWARSNIDYEWPVKTMKSGPRRGQIVFDPKVHDMVDAYIIARSGVLSCK